MRVGGFQVVDVHGCSSARMWRRPAPAPRGRALPCRRSSNRSSAWWCWCARRSRRPVPRRIPCRRTPSWRPRACSARVRSASRTRGGCGVAASLATADVSFVHRDRAFHPNDATLVLTSTHRIDLYGLVRTLSLEATRMSSSPSFLVGLIGAGIGPSLSPALHEREAAALGLHYLYRRHRPRGTGSRRLGRTGARAVRARSRLRRAQHHPPLQADGASASSTNSPRMPPRSAR